MLVLVAMAAFYVSTWEEYYTGTMYLGVINGPTEGLVIACMIMLTSGIWGAHIWSLPLSRVISSKTLAMMSRVLPVPLTHVTVASALATLMIVMFVTTQLPFSLYNVYRALSVKGSWSKYSDEVHYSPNGGYLLKLMHAKLGLLQIVVLVSATVWWMMAPGTAVMQNHMALLFMVGVVFANMASNIILAYLLRRPFPHFTWTLLPLIAGAVMANS